MTFTLKHKFSSFAATGLVLGSLALAETKSEPQSDSVPPKDPAVENVEKPASDPVFKFTSAAQPKNFKRAGFSFLKTTTVAPPLEGYVALCNRVPSQCDFRSKQQDFVELDDNATEQLFNINAKINAEITPASDQDIYGQSDFWNIPEASKGMKGDCEDYVLYKIQELSKAGISKSAMSIVFVVTPPKEGFPDGEGHAVLALRTKTGDLLLDNQTDDIKTPDKTKYRFLRAVSLHDATWRNLIDPPKPETVMASKGDRLVNVLGGGLDRLGLFNAIQQATVEDRMNFGMAQLQNPLSQNLTGLGQALGSSLGERIEQAMGAPLEGSLGNLGQAIGQGIGPNLSGIGDIIQKLDAQDKKQPRPKWEHVPKPTPRPKNF